MELDYDQRIINETNRFDLVEDLNELPPIFHYWSNRYLRPQLEKFGFSHPDGFFAYYAKEAIKTHHGSMRILSIGSGNCDTEVRLAKTLRKEGFHDFIIDCMDINQTMFARGLKLAEEEGVTNHLRFLKADFNSWESQQSYGLIIANQSLHHVVKLEHLFAEIKKSLPPEGYFITSDIIGRNGHQRWPEAVKVLKKIWQQMPPRYRYNHQLNKEQKKYVNHDCSSDSFEGIRAQDVLPLLIKNFHFETFIPFANLILIFIDRGLGPNFDVNNPEDIAFIDRIHQLDEELMLAGTIQPTQLMAAMQLNPSDNLRLRHPKLTPEFCLRQ
ncbi:hypothetical protein GCM10011365_22900 [Marinicella pacifica]|uniref:Methyltransferase domain-containing protein n=1 Tax=Marinicella pacifica TaxID=1171543 RepID=A0A917FTX7_9GAMM|nr:class I SAM-dependent methyltransferase [Marinicella pacifica]GGG01035.1 hypothetical protein GCM10011365_22900 [Marinicella pacifica]